MRATLEFELPEDRADFEWAIDSGRWRGVVESLVENLRTKLKYEEHTEEAQRMYAELREEVFALIEEAGLRLWD